MTFATPLTLAAALVLGADPLAELQATLATLTAKSPVAARVTHHFETRSGEGKEATLVQGDLVGDVAEGPAGLDLHWSAEVLERARQEGRRRAADPEAAAPTQDALAELDALNLSRRLDVAGELKDLLAHATVTADTTEPLDGVPTRVLSLTLAPPLKAKDRKYVTELKATARLWLGPDGVPVAGERRVKTSGRAFLVITFENENVETYRFAHVGDRLLVARFEGEGHGSGAGEKMGRKSATTLEVKSPVAKAAPASAAAAAP